MKTKFTGTGGYEDDLKRAKEVFVEGQEYTINGGWVGGWDSVYTFEEVEGEWNTVMFDVRWENVPETLIEHTYLKENQ